MTAEIHTQTTRHIYFLMMIKVFRARPSAPSGSVLKDSCRSAPRTASYRTTQTRRTRVICSTATTRLLPLVCETRVRGWFAKSRPSPAARHQVACNYKDAFYNQSRKSRSRVCGWITLSVDEINFVNACVTNGI